MHEFIAPVDLELILVSFFESVCGGVKDAMQRKIEVQTHRLDAEQRQQLERAMAFFNDAQEALALFESGPADLLTEGKAVSVENIYQAYDGPTPILFVTGLPLSDNWFTHAERGVGVLTLSDWEVAFISDANGIGLAAPDAYILTSLALAVLCIIARVADYDVIHNDVTGCLFDLCAHKPDRIFKMRSAFVCQECTALLAERGVSAVEIDAIHAVLEIVRRLVLGRKPQRHSPVAPDDLGFLKQFADSNRFALPPRLIAACRERRITLFVGSGMSLQYDVDIAYPTETSWDRLPTWTEIPHRLAARLETYVGKKVWPRDTETLDEFLIDLDFFREKLGPILYYPRAIFDIFTPEVKSVGLAHRLLFRLPLAAVLTTNYDFVLQCAAPAGSPVYTWKEARAAREYLNGGGNLKPLLKLHGCASRPDTVVLTRVEYDTLRRDHEYISLVNSLLDHHAVLFLGFGFNDPRDLDLALREAQLAGASVGEKFAVLPAAKCAEARAKFPQLQVIPIEKHEDLAPLLAELIVKSQSI